MADALSAAPEVVVVADAAALADEATHRMEEALLRGPADRRARIVLAGGSTPEPAYRHLASRPVPWGRVEIFFSDERCVPPDHEDSNYRMVREALLDRVPLTPAAVHRIPGELDADDAATHAVRDLRHSGGGVAPAVDLAVLGMGADGHTASLFPGAPAPPDGALAVAVAGEPPRVSLTLSVLNGAAARLVLVDGAAKASALSRALAGDRSLPAGCLVPAATTWLVTEAAAADLDQS